MKLNNRLLRNVKDNKSFYISSIMLTVLALAMFYLMNMAGQGIHDFGVDFFSRHNIEDGQFTTYNYISDDEIDELEKEFNVELENQKYINQDEDGFTARIFKKNNKINTYEITAGRDIEGNQDIIISEGYAVNKNIKFGDTISLNQKQYTVCGFFQRPDYLYMLEELDDSYKNIETFFLCYISDDEFDTLKGSNSIYLVRYNEDNINEFRSAINDRYYTANYVSAEDNPRIFFVDEQAMMFSLFSWIILIVVASITVALIGIIIGRKIKYEQKMIGTLTALGYRKRDIIWHYTLMAVWPGVAGGIFATVITYIFQQPYGELCLADYEPLHATFKISTVAAVLGILIPTFLYGLRAALSVIKLLKNDTVVLLSGNAEGERKTKKLWVNKDKKVRKKFAYRILIGNPGRTFVVLLGLFLGSFIATFGFMMFDTIGEASEIYKKQLGNFKNEYILNTLLDDESIEGEKLLIGNYEHNGKKITVIGLDSNQTLINIDTDEGKADIENGWYLSNISSIVCNAEKGDNFTINSLTTLEEKNVHIEGIVKSDVWQAVFTSRKNVADLMGVDSKAYNAIVTDKDIDIDDSLVVSTINPDSMEEQMDAISNEMNVVIYTFIFIGVAICIAAVYVSINMLISENRHNISMLKVLGYKEKEINQMIINANHILLPIGIILGMLADLFALKWTFVAIADMIGVLLPAFISFKSIVLNVVIVSACYFGTLAVIKRKTNRVDMVECLKDNRE